MRLPFFLLTAALAALAIGVPAASAATGDLTFASCQANAAITGQSCTTTPAGLLDSVSGIQVQISPDGKNAYAATTTSNAITIFDRDAKTGALTIKTGAAGCFVKIAIAGQTSCTPLGDQLDSPRALAISADGKNVYVVASTSGTLLTFNRDATTGALTLSSTNGCISNAAILGCSPQTDAINDVAAVTVSPDGKTVYTVATVAGSPNLSGLVSAFPRDPTTGALTTVGYSCVSSATDLQKRCVVNDGIFDTSFPSGSKLLVAPDGHTAYLDARTSSTIAIFDRDATTGVLTLKPGAAGCIANATLGSCAVVSGYMPSPLNMTMSPDGSSIYVVSGDHPGSIDTMITFSRNATTGALTKLVGAGGCLASAAFNDCTVLNPATQTATNLASVAISPDGLSAYATAPVWNMLLAFNRDSTTGALTLKSGAAGCFTSVSMAPCTTTTGLLTSANPVTVSPDGRSVYAGGATDISIFARSRPPLASTFTPATGTTAGGTSVVITGTNLDGTLVVTFGGTAGTITANTPTSLTVTTPLHIAGKVAVVVTTADGTQTSPAAFKYALPAVKSVITTSKPKVRIKKKTIVLTTWAAVSGPGSIRQVVSRVIRGKRVGVCTATKTTTRAGGFKLSCVIGLASRSALRRGRLRLSVLTTFSPTGGNATSTLQSVALTRHR